MSLLSHELIHLLLTSLVAVFVWVRLRNKKLITGHRSPAIPAGRPITDYWLLITGVFLVGFFLDVDHFFDYFMWSGGQFVLSEFLNPSLYVHLSGKVYVPFHGFDIGIIIFFASRWLEKYFKVPGLSLALTLSYFGHLFWDNFSFSHHPFAYFFIHRLLNSFSLISFEGI